MYDAAVVMHGVRKTCCVDADGMKGAHRGIGPRLMIRPMALDGIVLDLDGTLVDTNGTHVEAWRRVLADHGYVIAPDRIFDEVGKGGDKLVPSLLGRAADR